VRLLILAQAKRAYTTRRLVEAARKLKHKVEIHQPTRFRLGFGDVTFIEEGGNKIEDEQTFDAVLPRFAASMQTYGNAVLSQLEASGVRSFNPSVSVRLVRDRIRCMQALVGAGVPVPRAALIRRPEDVDTAISAVGGLPVMLRRVSGEPTFGGLFCETRQGTLAVLEAMWGLSHEVLVSEHYSELSGEGLRCLVVDGDVVAAIRRKGRTVRTRFRFERHGKAVEAAVPKALSDLMRHVARVSGLGLAGVDVLETSDGYRVLEVNAVPGIEQLEATTGRDLARVVIEATLRFAAHARMVPANKRSSVEKTVAPVKKAKKKAHKRRRT
jgi:ribosomal protein S6--L-glutamate ligase